MIADTTPAPTDSICVQWVLPLQVMRDNDPKTLHWQYAVMLCSGNMIESRDKRWGKYIKKNSAFRDSK